MVHWVQDQRIVQLRLSQSLVSPPTVVWQRMLLLFVFLQIRRWESTLQPPKWEPLNDYKNASCFFEVMAALYLKKLINKLNYFQYLMMLFWKFGVGCTKSAFRDAERYCKLYYGRVYEEKTFFNQLVLNLDNSHLRVLKQLAADLSVLLTLI